MKTALLILAFSLSIAAQTNQFRVKGVLLSSAHVCGGPDILAKDKIVGTVVKREFDQDQLSLAGIVIRNAKDQRTFVNVDVEYVKNTNLMGDLSDYLIVGRRVNASLNRCSHIYYLAKL